MEMPIPGNPLVCVVMPCYNHEAYVGAAIESVLAQTYTNFELYIINDGSTDGSQAVIESYLEDPRVHYFEFRENTKYFGVIRMYKRCIEVSGAKYVASLASDDMWKPEKLQKQVAVLENSPHYKACFTWDEVLYEDGAGAWMLAPDYSEQINRSRYEWFYFFLRWGNRINACSMLMDSAVYLELGGYNPHFRALGDLYLWMLFTTRYSFYLIPEKLTCYRRHGANLSTGDSFSTQSYTEDYLLSRHLVVEMSREFFVKTFSYDMLYADVENPLVLAAEEIALLLARGRYEYDQIAIEMYIAYASDAEFVELMETRYGLGTKELHELMRNHGLAAAGANKPKGYTLEPLKDRARILLNDITHQALSQQKLQQYTYSFLLEALTAEGVVEADDVSDNTGTQVDRLRNSLYILQKQMFFSKAHRKVVCIVGSYSGWNSTFATNLWVNPEEEAVYYCVLPKQAEVFAENAAGVYERPSHGLTLEIFNKEEHYIASCMEAGVSPDLLVFVDCIESGYSWEYVLRKYPLSVMAAYISTTGAAEDLPILQYLERIGV